MLYKQNLLSLTSTLQIKDCNCSCSEGDNSFKNGPSLSRDTFHCWSGMVLSWFPTVLFYLEISYYITLILLN